MIAKKSMRNFDWELVKFSLQANKTLEHHRSMRVFVMMHQDYDYYYSLVEDLMDGPCNLTFRI